MSKERGAGSADFDFFIGDWHVAHRQLKRRLADCKDWLEFDGATSARLLLDGHANVDDNVLNHPHGRYRAVTMRAFDPAARTWSIWWLDGRFPGQLDVPMVGRFAGGLGTFYADDSFEGRKVRVRFRWDARYRRAGVGAGLFAGRGGALGNQLGDAVHALAIRPSPRKGGIPDSPRQDARKVSQRHQFAEYPLFGAFARYIV